MILSSSSGKNKIAYEFPEALVLQKNKSELAPIQLVQPLIFDILIFRVHNFLSLNYTDIIFDLKIAKMVN